MNRELSNTINLCLNAVNCITLLTIFFLTLKKIEKSKNNWKESLYEQSISFKNDKSI